MLQRARKYRTIGRIAYMMKIITIRPFHTMNYCLRLISFSDISYGITVLTVDKLVGRVV
ncbi:MAG: hypothetical protein K0S76_2735 [Herbinix sp.]|jgi:hypothetical protein|nr:hypothetical protein [Herbinix sp.]